MRCPRARRVTSATLRDFERRLQGCVRVCIYIYLYGSMYAWVLERI